MTAETRNALALVPAALAPRLDGVLRGAGIRMIPAPGGDACDGATAFVACAAQPVHFILLSQRPDGSETAVCRSLRTAGFPVLLLTSATGPVQVNAARKAVGANQALPASFADADFAAAVRTMAAEHPMSVDRKEVKHDALTPAAAQDPAWNLGRYCLRKSTGSLRLAASHGSAECTVLLSAGVPIAATSNVRGPRLGEILVRKGRLTADQVERALRVVERKGVRIGTVLVDQGVLSREEVLREVGAQYAMRILTVFAWPAVTTTVRFEDVSADDARIPLTREALTAEGVRRQYDGVRLKGLLPDKAVFQLAPDAAPRLALFSFTPKEAAAIAMVDGQRPLSEIVIRSGAPLDALRALYTAASLDLVRPAG